MADGPFGVVRDEIGPALDADQPPVGVDDQDAARAPVAESLDGAIQGALAAIVTT